MSLPFQILILALTSVGIVHYPKPPLDMAYQLPNHDTSCQPVLAVACRNGCVALLYMLTSVTNARSLISNLYTYSADGDPESEVSFVIAPPKANHSVGAIAWGRNQTSSYLFASSEPWNSKDHSGAHRALDIQEAKTAYNFNAKEAGDAMTVDDSGKCALSSVLYTRYTK